MIQRAGGWAFGRYPFRLYPLMSTTTEMQVSVEELNPCTVKLSVVCTPEQVKAGYAKAYREAAKRIKVPGFRPGSAPVAMVKQYANLQVVGEMAMEAVVADSYKEALKLKGIEAHSMPKVEVSKLSEDPPECEYVAKVPLPPKVELGEFENLTAKRPDVTVTDEEVEEQVRELQAGKAKRRSVEGRGAQNGDFAVVNIAADGQEPEGRNFMTVVGNTFPQLDQALQDLRLDDIKHVDLTFPEQFQEKDWAGKTLSCIVRLKSLSAPELPELTDEFAQQFSAESVEDLKSRIRAGIERAKFRMVENYVHEQLLTGLLEKSTVSVPDPMWEDVAEQRMREIAYDAERRGATLEELAQANDMTVEQLYERVKDEAQAEVKRAVLLTEVFQKAGLKIEPADMTAEVELMARDMNMTAQDALKAIRKARRLDEVQFRALRKKVLNLLVEKAKIERAEIA